MVLLARVPLLWWQSFSERHYYYYYYYYFVGDFKKDFFSLSLSFAPPATPSRMKTSRQPAIKEYTFFLAAQREGFRVPKLSCRFIKASGELARRFWLSNYVRPFRDTQKVFKEREKTL